MRADSSPVCLTIDDGGLLLVVESSGRLVFRVWFGESFHPRDEIAMQLVDLGAVIEWSSPNVFQVGSPSLRYESPQEVGA